MYGSHFIPDLISLRRLRVIFKATFPRFLSSLLTPSLLCAQTALLSRTHSLSVHFHRNTVCVRACVRVLDSIPYTSASLLSFSSL